MKHLTLVLLAAFALPVMAASINLNSSRSNAVEDADSVKNSGHASERQTTVRGSKSNSSDRAITFGRDSLNNAGPAEATTVKGSKSNGSDRVIQGGAGAEYKDGEDGVNRTKGTLGDFNLSNRTTTVNGSKSNNYRVMQGGAGAAPALPTTVKGSKSNASAREFGSPTTVKGSKSNSDNRSIGSAVPDACKPNEFCASGQHFPQPLKK
jgi:hypothetical protein